MDCSRCSGIAGCNDYRYKNVTYFRFGVPTDTHTLPYRFFFFLGSGSFERVKVSGSKGAGVVSESGDAIPVEVGLVDDTAAELDAAVEFDNTAELDAAVAFEGRGELASDAPVELAGELSSASRLA
jgi:hypothetical protein